MRLALIPASCSICPQCGEDWESQRPEYCRRCGSPFAGYGFDPLKAQVYGNKPVRVNRSAKLIVRSGILAIGMTGLFTGILLIYGGWFSSGGLDAIQLWVSRAGGPLLVIQGVIYSWLPFRRPGHVGGVIIPFTVR